MNDLQYPVGRFAFPESPSASQVKESIDEIARTPFELRAAVAGLSAEQLDTPYRPGGWTVRQVAHHVPDSHINAYVRFRLALTESEPTIKPYEEGRWAELPDARIAPVDVSLALLEALHHRWTILMRSLAPGDWKRTFRHPELGVLSLERQAGLYAWHGRHHVAHVIELRKRMGWM